MRVKGVKFCQIPIDFEKLEYATTEGLFIKEAVTISNEVFKNIFILLSVREKPLLTLEEAIIYGLFLRANKLFCSFIRLTNEDDSIGARFLCRGITDSLIDMMYLIKKDSKELYDCFVQLPFYDVRDQLEKIKKNQETNEPQPIENRMEKSILDMIKKSGKNFNILNDLSSKKDNKWFKIGIKEKFKELGYDEKMHLFMQTNVNNVIHSNWDVILKNHLEYRADNAYEPKLKDVAVRPQMILFINRFLCKSALKFIQWAFVNEEAQEYLGRVFYESLEKIIKIDSMHEDFLIGKQKQ